MSEEPQEPVADGGPASRDEVPSSPPGPEPAAGRDAGQAPGDGDTAPQAGPPSRPLGRRAQAAAKKAEREAAKKAEEIKALKDAEIPADAYVVELPTFQGPLDLLLHLIQKHELDILDIPVSFVTEKYLAYLDVMRKLSIDVASEYLVMAATLIFIKSKMLLPQLPGGQDDVEEEEEDDPRAELVRRLLDYQKYKAAAEELGDNPSMLGRDVFGRGSEEIAPPGPAPFQPFGVFNLFDALEKVFARTKTKVEHNVVFDRISITDRIVELTQKMKARRQMLFEELFDADRTTFEVVITFLAVLEMCKLKLMRVYQADVLASIHVELMIVDDIAEGDELEFAQSGGQSLASGPLPTAMKGEGEGQGDGESGGKSESGGTGDGDDDEDDEDDEDDDDEDDEDDDEDDEDEDDEDEPASALDAEPNAEADVEAEPIVEAEPSIEPLVEPVVEAEPSIEPLVEPVVEAEPLVEPVVDAEPVDEAEPVVEAEPQVEPVVEAEPSVEPVVDAEQAVEAAGEPESLSPTAPSDAGARDERGRDAGPREERPRLEALQGDAVVDPEPAPPRPPVVEAAPAIEPEPVVEAAPAVEPEPLVDAALVDAEPVAAAPTTDAGPPEAAPIAVVLDADAAFEAEFAALLAEEEAERQAALAAQVADETKPPDAAPATVVDD